MARTTGPLMSLGASGSVAKTVTFASWKGRSYVRRLVVPANPRSPGQLYSRAMMRFLSQAWAPDISTLDQALWKPGADALKISPFNEFTRVNRMGWTQSLAPSYTPTPARSGTQDVMGSFTLAGGVGQISITLALTTKNLGWGVAWGYHTSSSTSPLSGTSLITDTSQLTSGSNVLATITGVPPGTYYMTYWMFTQDGNLQVSGTTSGGTAVVT